MAAFPSAAPRTLLVSPADGDASAMTDPAAADSDAPTRRLTSNAPAAPTPAQARGLVSHERPVGVDDATVAAVGKLDKALETLERTRGRLYDFHQMSGTTDLQLQEAVDALRDAGHQGWADQIATDIVGRNVLDGRWTFQIVEEYERTYVTPFREAERAVREALLQGRRHVFEAELKEAERTRGAAGHEARPDA